MARMTKGERGVTLGATTMVGRDPSCAFALADRRASSLHARLAWNGLSWMLRDLGSTNGTFVDGVRVPPGVDRPLREGTRVAFGDAAEVWVVDDVGPPCARAVDAATGEGAFGEGGVLVLGRGSDAVTLVEAAGRWTLVDGATSRLVSDGEVLVVGGRRYTLELPVVAALTPISATDDDHGVALSFRVGDDEETIDLTVVSPAGASVVPPRTGHYLLLTLARARIHDRGGGFTELQAGWREVDELCRALATDENRLNVEVHRVRKQLAAFGVPATVIDRRAGERRLRIGVARLVIVGR